MNIGFFNIFNGSGRFQQTQHLVMADMLIRSIRKVMPDVPIYQLTNGTSPQIMGVDHVRRIDQTLPMAVLCVEHYRRCEGDWLLLDTDILVQEDVRDVFNDSFDLAVADREGCLVDGESELDLIKEMPYNIGVMFSRSSAFWQRVLETMIPMDDKKKHWMGNQYAACDVILSGEFAVKFIPGRRYNCPPLNLEDRCAEAAIIHFKGNMRKQMMLKRFYEV